MDGAADGDGACPRGRAERPSTPVAPWPTLKLKSNKSYQPYPNKSWTEDYGGSAKVALNIELEEDFSMNQALGLWLLDAIPQLDRESPEVEAGYTLFMYEDLRAIKQACTELGIVAREEIEMIFHSNATRLIAGIQALKQGSL